MKRINSFDTIKSAGIFAVVALHCGLFANYLKEGPNHIQVSINILTRFAVPFFFMVSGYLFCEKLKVRTLNEQLFKYIKRIISPLIKWNMIYFILYGLAWYWWQTPSFTSIFIHGTGFSVPLWYLVGLIQAILILSIFIKLKQEKLALFISGALLLFGMLGQSYRFIYHPSFFKGEGDFRNGLFFGFFFVTAGYLFSKYNTIISKELSKKALIGSIICMVLSIVEGNYLWMIKENGAPSEYYLFTIPCAILLFIFALGNPLFGKDSIFEKIGNKSEQIYLNHGVVLAIYGTGVWIYKYNPGAINAKIISDNFLYQLLIAPIIFTIIVITTFGFEKLFNKIFGDKKIKKHLSSSIFLNVGLLTLFLGAKMGEKGPQQIFDINKGSTLLIILIISIGIYLLSFETYKNKSFLKDSIFAVKIFLLYLVLSKAGYLIKLRFLMHPDKPNIFLNAVFTYTIFMIIAVGATISLRIVYDKISNKFQCKKEVKVA